MEAPLMLLVLRSLMPLSWMHAVGWEFNFWAWETMGMWASMNPPQRLIRLVTWWIYRMPPGDKIQHFLEEILRRCQLRRSPLASMKFWRRTKFIWW
jgi:hypothetical protein